MLKMQVPDGKPKAGMVHHKIHDKEWTALGIAPRPGRAAALPVAAVDGGDAEPGGDGGAVRAHLARSSTRSSPARCLTAAEKAWAAAQANPAVFAGTAAVGGGPYDDKDVSDEFYWAAAELYVDDQEGRLQGVRSRSRRTSRRCRSVDGDDGIPTSMTWGDGRARSGRSRWRRCRTACPPKDIDDCKARASRRRPTASSRSSTEQGYRVPFKPGKKGFPWGSNSFVLNNAIVMALAPRLHGRRAST